jgi:Protein of unknown function (DUF410).
MSAAAARRRKQLAAKAALASQGGKGTDPISDQLQSLLSSPTPLDESTAYEALQLAQSQVRKCVKSGEYEKATVTFGYEVCQSLLQKHSKASVASQLLALLGQVLTETHTVCTPEWLERIRTLDQVYLEAVVKVVSETEKQRLYRLHRKFLKTVLMWSDVLGDTVLGSCEIHELVAKHSWFLSQQQQQQQNQDQQVQQGGGGSGNALQNQRQEELVSNKTGAAEDDDYSPIALQSESVTHFALAEKPMEILDRLASLPDPTAQETKLNHVCPPARRESLLTRSILVMVTMENLRDAHVLLKAYIEKVEKRDLEELKKSYMSKTDKKKSPNHVVFLSMLLSIVQKDKKTGPLYTWLLKGFSNAELAKMYKPDILKGYTTKIGRVYFDIQPPPSMMATLENMMSMMGGGGGMGGMPPINPAMMQAMMQGGGGGGF